MTQNNGSVSVSVVTKEENPSFLNDKVKLDKLSKELSKVSKEAIDVLVTLLASSDEKVRMQAASKLLEFDIDVKKAMSNDQMQRMIAEIKLNRQPQTKLVPLSQDEEEEQRKNRPVVDFTTIRSIA
jgi:hypothetical protein